MRRPGEEPNPAQGGPGQIPPQGRERGPERQRFGTPPPMGAGEHGQRGGGPPTWISSTGDAAARWRSCRVKRAAQAKECRALMVSRLRRNSTSSSSEVARLPQRITARPTDSRKVERENRKKKRHRHGHNNFGAITPAAPERKFRSRLFCNARAAACAFVSNASSRRGAKCRYNNERTPLRTVDATAIRRSERRSTPRL